MKKTIKINYSPAKKGDIDKDLDEIRTLWSLRDGINIQAVKFGWLYGLDQKILFFNLLSELYLDMSKVSINFKNNDVMSRFFNRLFKLKIVKYYEGQKGLFVYINPVWLESVDGSRFFTRKRLWDGAD